MNPLSLHLTSMCIYARGIFSQYMEINHQPIYLRAVDAGTRPCNQHRALASVCKIRSEYFDCPIKEGPHYDLARTICMLYSTEFE